MRFELCLRWQNVPTPQYVPTYGSSHEVVERRGRGFDGAIVKYEAVRRVMEAKGELQPNLRYRLLANMMRELKLSASSTTYAQVPQSARDKADQKIFPWAKMVFWRQWATKVSAGISQ